MGENDGGHGRLPLYNITTQQQAVDAQSIIFNSPVGMVFGAVFFIGIENNERGGFWGRLRPTIPIRTTTTHFYEKLRLLKDRINTPTGRAIAETRQQFMEGYLRRFYEEWEGERWCPIKNENAG